jgi:excisionase family DNA binding protein
MAPEPWLTKRELAQLLGCSTRTIERLDLPAMRVGGQNRYQLTEVEAHLRGEKRRAELVVFPGVRGSEPAA